MREDNHNVWKPFLDMTNEYILNLKTSHGKSLVTEDSRKTGFVGIIANIHSVQEIFKNIVVNGRLEYLCLYKLSQDHLEHFFGLIRARFGAQTNPTPFQFQKTYRQILLGITGSIVNNSNVMLQDTTEMVALIPSTQSKLDYISENYDIEDISIESVANSSLSDYKKHVVNYILAMLLNKLVKNYLVRSTKGKALNSFVS